MEPVAIADGNFDVISRLSRKSRKSQVAAIRVVSRLMARLLSLLRLGDGREIIRRTDDSCSRGSSAR
jgi:hypothetical protein